MTFQGNSFTKIGNEFDIHSETIRNWSRCEERKVFTQELIEATKAGELEALVR